MTLHDHSTESASMHADHAAPEAAAGGAIALIEEGDTIQIDIPAHTLNVKLADEELAARRAAFMPPPERPLAGWLARYCRLVAGADRGAVLE